MATTKAANVTDECTDALVSKDKNEKEQLPTIPYMKLYHYAQPYDWFLMSVGSLLSFIAGLTWPTLFVFFGNITTSFTFYGRYQTCDFNYQTCFQSNLTILNETQWNVTIQPLLDSFVKDNYVQVYGFVGVGAVSFVLYALQVYLWNVSAARQAEIIRIAYFRSMLRQDIGFHDVISSGELNSRLSSDIKLVKKGIGDKVSFVIGGVVMGVASFLVAFIYTWKVAAVTTALSPFLILPGAVLYMLSDVFKQKELSAYAKAGSIAEEAISSIKTVVAFGCQLKEVDRYADNLFDAKKMGMLRSSMTGLCLGFMYLATYTMYGLAMWYGTTLVIQGEIESGDMIMAMLNVMLGAYSFAAVGSYLEVFPQAAAAGAKIFEIIDRVPEIDVFSNEGKEPSFEDGEIHFEDVEFSYPARPDIDVLKGMTFTIKQGERVALVGQSGCGKSTIIQLIQRFYDVKSGLVTIGGQDVKALKVKSLRDMIGVVAQEPILFATTIAENIRWGREGVTDKEIHEAAKQANIYDFVMSLPKKFATLVGEEGGHMSGGQKQRIAIARAIVRNPKILLLDEATSSLDSHSESLVQAALDKASQGRTTVVVAHRLSTIRDADKIIAMSDGKLLEQGRHEELLKIEDGVYRNLINIQASREKDVTCSEESSVDFELANGDENYGKKEKSFLTQDSGYQLVSSATPQHRSNIYQNKTKTEKKGKQYKNKEEKDETDEDEEDVLPKFDFMQILKMNAPEWLYLVVGCIFALIAGATDPINAIFFAEIFKIFTLSDPEEQYSKASFLGILFFLLGVISFIGFLVEGIMFGKSGMEFTVRLRTMAFRSILRQDISYFDDHKHSTGSLCKRLAFDATRVQGCTGATLGIVIKNLGTLAVALSISFAYGWKLTLVVLAFIPPLVVGGVIEYSTVAVADQEEELEYDKAGTLATEAILNIRTVASLTKEAEILKLYEDKVIGTSKTLQKKCIVVALAFGFSQCVVFFAFGGTFAMATTLIANGEMTFEIAFLVQMAIIIGAMTVAQNTSFAPDFAEGMISARRIMALFDQIPSIDAYSTEGATPDHCKGEISIKSVSFRYPLRPTVPVLRDLNITIKPGQTVALVGQSGCGKSTTTKLIERFYDPDEGSLFLDGIDIRKLNVSWLRQQMGLVSQEPVLFDGSITENILYGDSTRIANDEEVKEVAEKANIGKFISDLPEGFATNAGSKGGKLSGGQKQRIAIARALLRNPKILLLDEATSALDTENEQIVQEALDAARESRTSIVIAHRLSTVKNADQIVVIDSGSVIEFGTHEELMSKQGAYYSLVNTQTFKNE